jgi:hypothetical protein
MGFAIVVVDVESYKVVLPKLSIPSGDPLYREGRVSLGILQARVTDIDLGSLSDTYITIVRSHKENIVTVSDWAAVESSIPR